MMYNANYRGDSMNRVLRAIKYNIFGAKPVEYCSAKKIQKIYNDGDYIIVDTRPSGEFKQGSIINSINIPQTSFISASRKKLHPKMKVLLVDRNGFVAVNGYYTLKDRNFHHVRVLKGGINNIIKNYPYMIQEIEYDYEEE